MTAAQNSHFSSAAALPSARCPRPEGRPRRGPPPCPRRGRCRGARRGPGRPVRHEPAQARGPAHDGTAAGTATRTPWLSASNGSGSRWAARPSRPVPARLTSYRAAARAGQHLTVERPVAQRGAAGAALVAIGVQRPADRADEHRQVSRGRGHRPRAGRADVRQRDPLAAGRGGRRPGGRPRRRGAARSAAASARAGRSCPPRPPRSPRAPHPARLPRSRAGP